MFPTVLNVLRLCAAGQVVYTGSSSMDVRLILKQAHLDHPSMIALITFVARDPSTQKATKINPVVPQNAEQKQWFDERARIAEARKAARKAAADMTQNCCTAGSAAQAGLGDLEKRQEWSQGLLAEARLINRMPGVM